MKYTVLFVTELCPFPPYGGELIRCYNLIDALCQYFNVVLLSPKPDEDCELMRKLYAWHDLKDSKDWLYRLPFKILPYPPLTQLLKTLCQEYTPQITWFDYRYWGQYVPTVQHFGSRTIMGTHNVQSKLTRQKLMTLPRNTIYFKTLLHYQLEYLHERFLFKRFDKVISVSESDRRYYSKIVGETKSRVVPNFINESYYNPTDFDMREDNCLIVTGNFCAFQNVLGAQWLLKRIWPSVYKKIPNARLKFVGRGAETIIPYTKHLKGISCIGEVPSIVPYLRSATVAAVPLLHGSGTRIKILEAMACAVAIVTTSLGAEGLKLTSRKDCIIADSPDDFAKAIIELFNTPAMREQLAQNGLKLLIEEYGWQVNVERIRQLIEDTVSSP